MNIVIIVVLIITALIAWKLRGVYEYRKSEVFKKKLQEERDKAKRALGELREFGKKVKPLATKITVIDGCWELRQFAKGVSSGNKFLRHIGTTPEEVNNLAENYINLGNLQDKWRSLMNFLAETDHSQSSFEYYLRCRTELLAKNKKTLADFGVEGDDTVKLRMEFYVRITRHITQRAIDHLVNVENEISRLDTERTMLPTSLKCVDDFGIPEVRRRIDLLRHSFNVVELSSI